MNRLLILLLLSPFVFLGQTMYNPQDLYDNSGGLFDEDSLREIHLDFYDSDYHSILVDSWFYDPSYRIPAKLTLNGVIYDSVGVRYKGNSTFCLPNDNSSPKVPYNIDINYFIDEQRLLGYKKIKLANAWMDPTFVKQIVSSNIYRRYLPTGESNLVKLYSQGNYVGLYVNDESINKQFLEKHFDEKSGPLFKCDNIDRFCDTANAPSAMPPNLYYMGDDTTLYYNSYDMKSDYGWEELVNLIKTISLDFENIDSVLNVDRTLWAFAANQVISNLDCYNTYYVHNYYLYQTKDGLFQMIPWDLDNSFIGAILGSFWWFPQAAYEYDPYSVGEDHDNNGFLDIWEERPLVQKLLANPLYRDIYNAHLRTIINESLDTVMLRSNINQLQSLASSAANQDYNKVFSMSEYYENVDNEVWTFWGFAGIMSTVDERKSYLLSHPEISQIPPVLSSVNVADDYVTVSVSNANTVELLATISDYNSKFHSFSMHDDGTNGDVLSNDGIYTAPLPFSSSMNETVKFYFRARNNNALALLPERAEYEFFEFSLSTSLSNSSNSPTRKLINVVDLLGKKVVNAKKFINQPLFYMYDDGTVEKRIILE